MSIENRNKQHGQDGIRRAGSKRLKLAAWGILSGALLCGVARAAGQAESKGNADGSNQATAGNPAAPAGQSSSQAGYGGNATTGAPATGSPAGLAPAPAGGQPSAAAPGTGAPGTAQPVAPVPSGPQIIELPVAVGSAPADPSATAGGSQPTTRPAAESIVTKGLDAQGKVTLMVGKTALLTTRGPIRRLSVGQPDVADATVLGPSELLVTARKAGSTELIVWDAEGHSQIVDMDVRFDLRTLEAQVKGMFPKSAVTAESANGAIVLRGHVPDLLTAQQITQVTTPYATSGAVVNFLEVSGGQQVVLQVRFAEVSRSISQGFGFNAFATDGKFKGGINEGPGASPTGSLATSTAVNVDSTVPFYGAGGIGNTEFEFFITALRNNNLLRVLAEPNLTCISGQTATFLAGGEFPIPVPQAGGGGSAITIEYKQYGVQLNFTPTVLGDGRIRLNCTPQVSDLDYTNSVTLNGFIVPGVTSRNVNTTVELAEGQTFALAGLLDNRVVASNNITPLLGDIPVLGRLFRSVKYMHSDTELVVLVTPRLVEPMNPGRIPRLPGDPWRDPTELQLFVNSDLGGPSPDMRHAPSVRSSHYYGTTGFQPAPAAP